MKKNKMKKIFEFIISIPSFILEEFVEDIQVLIKKINKDIRKFLKRFI